MIPTQFVVDASVIVNAALPDELQHTAAGTLVDLAARGHFLLVAPDHLRIEVASAVTKASRRRRISPDDAREIVAWLPDLPIELRTSEWPLILRAAEISLATSLGFYDCLFIALAESLRLPLVTSDDRQAGRAGEYVRAVGLRDALESVGPDA